MKKFRSPFIKNKFAIRGLDDLLPVPKKEGEEEVPEHKTGRAWVK